MTTAAIFSLLITWSVVISISAFCIWKVFHSRPGPPEAGPVPREASELGSRHGASDCTSGPPSRA